MLGRSEAAAHHEGFRHHYRRDRILAKLDELEGYLGELRSIVPDRLGQYSGSRSAARASVSCRSLVKGLRNILVPEYGRVSDALVFETIQTRLDDFVTFKREILAFVRTA
jgi:hypothetical protein